MKKDNVTENDIKEDDGRVIADMSDIERTSLFGILSKKKMEIYEQSTTPENPNGPLLNKEERGAFILGALGAALLIGFVFMGAIGLAILIMVLLWR